MGPTLSNLPAYFEPPGETPPPYGNARSLLLREWLAALYDRRTCRHQLSAANWPPCARMFKFLHAGRADLAERGRPSRTPKTSAALPEVMSAEKTNNLLDAVDGGNLVEMPSKERDIAIFELLYGCGIRVSELVGINLEDIDLRQRLAARPR